MAHGTPKATPKTAIGRRLDAIRQEHDLNQAEFWRHVVGEKGEGEDVTYEWHKEDDPSRPGISYDSSRRYLFEDRDIPSEYAARVVEAFPYYRLEWVVAGEEPRLVREEMEQLEARLAMRPHLLPKKAEQVEDWIQEEFEEYARLPYHSRARALRTWQRLLSDQRTRGSRPVQSEADPQTDAEDGKGKPKMAGLPDSDQLRRRVARVVGRFLSRKLRLATGDDPDPDHSLPTVLIRESLERNQLEEYVEAMCRALEAPLASREREHYQELDLLPRMG